MDENKIAGVTFDQFLEAKRVILRILDFADMNAQSEDEELKGEAARASFLLGIFSMAFVEKLKRVCEKQIARIDNEKMGKVEQGCDKTVGAIVIPLDSSVKN